MRKITNFFLAYQEYVNQSRGNKILKMVQNIVGTPMPSNQVAKQNINIVANKKSGISLQTAN